MAAGQEATPGDMKATEKLRQYWERGAGAAKIRWGEPGDFGRCVKPQQHAKMEGDGKG